MLLKALVRPVVNNVCKIPSRSTSAVVGAKSRHVPIGVSINFELSFLRINYSLRGKTVYFQEMQRFYPKILQSVRSDKAIVFIVM